MNDSYFVTGLKCVKCSREYEESPDIMTCPECGRDGILDVLYDYEKASKVLTRESLRQNQDLSHWRYLPVMPVRSISNVPPLRVGWSPLYDSRNLAGKIGLRKLILKDDGINPTASLKDRASSVGAARAVEAGNKAVTCASTGNAASSLAGSAAASGLATFIFVPDKAPEAKVAQLLIFGANVFLSGSYENAFEFSMACADEFGFYNRNSAVNPFMVEGKKTVSWEMGEQLSWEAPDYIFVAVGDGCTIAAVWKGFVEMKRMGFIETLPVVIGVQAEGSSPVLKAWKTGGDMEPVTPETLADSIAVGTPRNWRKAIDAVNESHGFFMAVTDDEILDAMRLLGKESGVFGEPAGVTGLAGIVKAVREEKISGDASVAAIVSGNGLKDVKSASEAAGSPNRVQNLDEARNFIKQLIE